LYTPRTAPPVPVLVKGPFEAAEKVARLNLDVLVYPGIGMHQATYMWCLQRLAPVQVMTWGHPVTSGSFAIDYFVSSDLFHTNGYTKEEEEEEEAERRVVMMSPPTRRRAKGQLNGSTTATTTSATTTTTTTAPEGTDRDGHLTQSLTQSLTHGLGAQDWFSEHLILFDSPGFFFPMPPGADLVLNGGVHLDGALLGASGLEEILLPPEDTTEGTPEGIPEGSPEGSSEASSGHHERRRRSELLLPPPQSPKVVACPQALMKLHPTFDAVLIGKHEISEPPPFGVILVFIPFQSRYRRLALPLSCLSL
jgi:hypothetical protein